MDRIPKKDLKISAESKKKFRKTSEMMKGFCFILSVTCLNRPNTGKDGAD
jgi:hypothetical protein